MLCRRRVAATGLDFPVQISDLTGAPIAVDPSKSMAAAVAEPQVKTVSRPCLTATEPTGTALDFLVGCRGSGQD